MVGRKEETKVLRKLISKNKSSFLAINGRRRIGKTYLIDSFFTTNICFRITGIQNATLDVQLNNFSLKLAEFSDTKILSSPKNWQEAFLQLKTYLKTLNKKTKQVIFIDELPWLATSKTGFLQLLAHLWNDYLSKEKHFILVVCGSASSWLINNIVNDKGGLHNRITDLINLKPFTIQETKEFLSYQGTKLNNQEVTKLYMAFGGVPYYLEQLRKGENSNMAIERICFADSGILKNEFDNLYKALYKNPLNHESIILELAKKPSGLTRKEIILKSKVKAGGAYDRTMNDLLSSGFITSYTLFGRKKRGTIYKLVDEFSIFYHKFMKANKKYTKGMWNQLAASQTYKIWCGFAFENLCYKHVDDIKKEIGIAAVYTEISSFRKIGTNETKGFQIDLILDRKDDTINLCEVKYYGASFKVDKKYAKELNERRQRFIEYSKTKKQVFTTLITNHSLIENEHSQSVIDSSITLDEIL